MTRNLPAAAPADAPDLDAPDLDALIVGAGFSGMYLLHRLRGAGFRARVYEAGGGVGGTWYWNRYPGARCDVESMFYSYQFDDALQQDWEWTERYAVQPDILRYANHVADRFALWPDMQFDTRVAATHWDDAAGLWSVRLEPEGGAPETVTARFCIMATGCLSTANLPEIPGRDSFRGATYHTGRWPHEAVDFTGLRVAVIGTGSSAIQAIPAIARQAAQVTVFQRTANYSIPAHNRPLDPAAVAGIKANYRALREEAKTRFGCFLVDLPRPSALAESPEAREAEFERRWRNGGLAFMASYQDLLFDPEANDTAADFVRARIRETVDDPETARKLMPTNVIGCKRMCVDTGYFETYNRPNVRLIDINDRPIREITASGVAIEGVAIEGEEIEADAIVFATGFDAMTGSLFRIDIRGRDGLPLRTAWDGGPRTYLGLAVNGFPNLFTITGPGSPSVLTNMMPSIEQHVEWVTDCIEALRDRGAAVIEAERAAQDDWVGHVNDLANASLRSTCSSWYIGANVPGKPRVFMPYIGGYPAYAARCADVAAADYEGFAIR